jgi:hypothetical protein
MTSYVTTHAGKEGWWNLSESDATERELAGTALFGACRGVTRGAPAGVPADQHVLAPGRRRAPPAVRSLVDRARGESLREQLNSGASPVVGRRCRGPILYGIHTPYQRCAEVGTPAPPRPAYPVGLGNCFRSGTAWIPWSERT